MAKSSWCVAWAAGVLAAIVVCVGCTSAKSAYEPTWESLAKHTEAPEWFRDDKFGIYFHWGVYCVPAFGSEWYPRTMHIKANREYKHHMETYGDPTKFGYADFVPMFQAEKFNADEWAELFVQAGARFAGPVAEHHDGFAMWDSEVTPWNAKDMGPKRDITGELEKAIRKRGMKFVATFHHARNSLWRKDGDWTGHYEFVKKDFPSLLDDPQQAILYGYMPREQFLEMWKGKLVEVIDKYRPDLMWFDAWFDEIPQQYQREYLAYYFNRAAEWGQEVVVTTKQDLPRAVAVDDFEKGRADRLTGYVWLTDDTISKGSWCYTQDLQIKDTAEVLHVLIDIVSKNGQLLLNISPKADGTIPQEQRDVLLGIGTWLKKYGQAIYGTRPWLTYGEGPTRMEKGGHFVRMKGGYTPQDIRYTCKGSTMYATTLGWPGANTQVVLTSFASDKLQGDLRVTGVSMLGSREPIEYERREDGLVLSTPGEKPDDLAVVFKIETTGSAEFVGPENVVSLPVDKAVLEGEQIVLESKVSGRQNVGFWDNPKEKLHWLLTVSDAGAYAVYGEFAGVSPSEVTFEAAGQSVTADVPSTGHWTKPKMVKLGRVEFDQPGVHHVQLRPADPATWKAVNLWQVLLRPTQ